VPSPRERLAHIDGCSVHEILLPIHDIAELRIEQQVCFEGAIRDQPGLEAGRLDGAGREISSEAPRAEDCELH
jgi:hypothetical protein